jgi:hypothetical protein
LSLFHAASGTALGFALVWNAIEIFVTTSPGRFFLWRRGVVLRRPTIAVVHAPLDLAQGLAKRSDFGHGVSN